MDDLVKALIAALNANTQAILAQAGSPQNQNQAAMLATPAAQLTATPAAVQPQPVPTALPNGQPITADALTALIQPHVGNDAIKAQLGDAMRSIGLQSFPEAQPHHYGPLYQKFTEVLAKFGIGAPAPAAQSMSII